MPPETSTVVTPETKPGVRVVTNENFDAYVREVMPPKPDEKAVETPEAKAAAELAKVEAEKAERVAAEKKAKDAEGEEIDHPDEGKKKGINERFSKITADKKAAEAK